MVIHLTDGLDAPLIEMQSRIEELQTSGKREHRLKIGLTIIVLSNCLSNLKLVYMLNRSEQLHPGRVGAGA